MSSGDVPRCPSCGLYLYPSDTATVHLCGAPWPNNAPASYPLKDWRDTEIESLRSRLAEANALRKDAERWRKAKDAAVLIYDPNARRTVQDFLTIWGEWGNAP